MKHKELQHLTYPDLRPETVRRLEIFCAFLAEQARAQNLVSHGDLAKLWERHVLDSLQLVSLMPPDASSGVDLGSGAGFPGLVLAIVTERPFTLIESEGRKVAFLAEAARLVDAPVTVIAARIEATHLPPSRLVTARAVAPLPRLLELAAPFVAEDGVCLLPKGKNADVELTAALRRWQMRVERWPSLTDPAASIFRISEIRRGRIVRTEASASRRHVSAPRVPRRVTPPARHRDREPEGRCR